MKVEILGMNSEDNTLNCFIYDDNGNVLEITRIEVPDFLEVKFAEKVGE